MHQISELGWGEIAGRSQNAQNPYSIWGFGGGRTEAGSGARHDCWRWCGRGASRAEACLTRTAVSTVEHAPRTVTSRIHRVGSGRSQRPIIHATAALRQRKEDSEAELPVERKEAMKKRDAYL